MTGDLTQPSSGLPPGAIAGIVIGVLAGVAVIAALVYFLFTRKTGGYDDFSSCSTSPSLTAMLERGKETLPLSLHLDLLLLLSKSLLLGTNSCGSLLHASWTPLSWTQLFPSPSGLEGGRSLYVSVSRSGKTKSQKETNEEMKGAGESESCALLTVVGWGDRTGREPKKRQKQPKAS